MTVNANRLHCDEYESQWNGSQSKRVITNTDNSEYVIHYLF